MLTGFTLVLALVITRVLGSLRWVFAQGRFYWVHATLVVAVLVLTSLVWWGLWYQRDMEWNYLAFAYNLLIGPGIIYYVSVLLVPDTPRRVRDWKAYFFEVRRLIYGALGALTVATFIGSVTIGDTPLAHPSHLITAVGFALALLGFFSAREWVQGGLAVAMSVLIMAAAVLAALSENVNG